MTRLGIRSAWIFSFSAKQCHRNTTVPALISIPSRFLSPTQITRSRGFSTFASRPLAHALSSTRSAAGSTSFVKADYQHTVAQIARAASQAVRVAIHEGKCRDAFYIANSALQSPLEPWVAPPTAARRLLNPVNFGRPVPTRLVVHTLIHALLREGYAVEAGREIRKMIAIGMRFRYKTIEAGVGLLCSKPSRPMETAPPSEEFERGFKVSKNDWNASRILRKKSARLVPETRLALDLLFAARESGRQRTERMYGWVVDACLLQGEIFAATLLFVVLVKDWQLRKVLKSAPVESDQHTDSEDATFTRHSTPAISRALHKRRLAQQVGLDNYRIKLPYPNKTIMQSILNSIDRRLFSLDPSAISEVAKADCEKSLSYLANLIDQRSLPFGQLAPLLRALYSCPMSRKMVHILEDDHHFHANVYNYSHQVLLRLCQSLPSQRPSPSPSHPEVLPQLDTRAYNTLIHYALRHRLSPALADGVIEHMTVYRKPPLHPDITTYNILLNSASTLRLPALANQVLNTLRMRHENPSALKLLPSRSLTPSSKTPESNRQFPHMTEHVTVPAIQLPSDHNGRYARVPSINVDVYTLSTYITHLVRTGRPEAIAEIIFHLIPELYTVDHPATSRSARDRKDATDTSHASQRESIQRAVAYGPYVFSALLNALQKANRTGLAERVWLLARQAERASWMQPEGTDIHTPWCLPIQAYTSMMQCYLNESKKGALLIRGSRYSRSLASELSLMKERQFWEPRFAGRIYVKGWAYFYLKMQAQAQDHQSSEPSLRWKTAREVGYLLLKSMWSGAISVWQSLISLHPENVRGISPQWATMLKSLKLPIGDARFFNAVLAIFGRRVDMQARRVRASPSWWSRKLRIAQKVYRESGWMPMAYDQTLVEIARGLAHTGYELPLGLQRALVGRITFSVRHNRRQDREVRPFGFPRPRHLRFRMFSLRVIKSRGLPLGRRKPEVMRKRRIEARRDAKEARRRQGQMGVNIVQ